MVKDCIQYSGSDVLARQCWHQREVTAKACAQIFLGYFNLVHFVKAMNIIESGCCDVSIWLKHTHQILFTQLPKLQKLLRHQKLGAAYRAPYFPKDWKHRGGGARLVVCPPGVSTAHTFMLSLPKRPCNNVTRTAALLFNHDKVVWRSLSRQKSDTHKIVVLKTTILSQLIEGRVIWTPL